MLALSSSSLLSNGLKVDIVRAASPSFLAGEEPVEFAAGYKVDITIALKFKMRWVPDEGS